MYKTFSELKKELRRENQYLKKVKTPLLSGTATQFLNIALRGAAIHEEINLEIFEAYFGQISRQILDPSSEYYEFESDYTILFESSHKLLERFYKLRGTQSVFA